jgi:diaminopimelate decarboxylase
MDGVSFENDANQFYDVTTVNGAKKELGDQEWCSMFGMTCDGRDVIASNLKMPTNLEVGDWIVMGGMGSYTYGPRFC